MEGLKELIQDLRRLQRQNSLELLDFETYTVSDAIGIPVLAT